MLHALLYIFSILSGIGILLTIVFCFMGAFGDIKFLYWAIDAFLITVLFLLVTILFLLGTISIDSYKKCHGYPKRTVKEYNSREYTLDYKIIEYNKDTVYVITPKS